MQPSDAAAGDDPMETYRQSFFEPGADLTVEERASIPDEHVEKPPLRFQELQRRLDTETIYRVAQLFSRASNRDRNFVHPFGSRRTAFREGTHFFHAL